MDVTIRSFPDTPVAAVEHHGAPEQEHQTARKLIAWRIANGLEPARHPSYGVH